MGFLKKAIKKVVKVVNKTAGAATGGLIGDSAKEDKPKEPAPVAAAVNAPEPASAAAQVEAPKEDTTTEDDGDSEAAKRAARSNGKRGLSVARSSGTGLNI